MFCQSVNIVLKVNKTKINGTKMKKYLKPFIEYGIQTYTASLRRNTAYPIYFSQKS